MTGLRLPLSTRPTPGTRGHRSYDVVDVHGRLITTIASDHFESATYRMFDAEAVATLWAEAANATAPIPSEVTA